MNLFEPLGEQARWRVIYDLLTVLDVGQTLTYEEMATALELDPDKDRHALQMAVRRAARESEESDKRALEAVPNVGYRVVEPVEHLRLARGQQRRAAVALRSGHSKSVNVNFNGLDPEVRHAFQVVAQAFAMQMDFNRRLDVQQKRLSDAVQAVSQDQQRSAQEITELRERLERLERAGEDSPLG